MLEFLRAMHPTATVLRSLGSAFMHWGADPREIAWSFWLPGINSDDVMATALQPDPELPLYIAGESCSRSQSWVEGALETAEAVTDRLLTRPLRCGLQGPLDSHGRPGTPGDWIGQMPWG